MTQTFGETVRQHRVGMGLSQRALAENLQELGVSIDQAAIARLERGGPEPRLTEGLQLAEYLGIEIMFLSGENQAITEAGRLNAAIHDYLSARTAVVEYLDSVGNAAGSFKPRKDETEHQSTEKYLDFLVDVMEKLPNRGDEFNAGRQFTRWPYEQRFLEALVKDLHRDDKA